MRINKTTAFIFISSLALTIVLMIQVSWIFQTAKIKEDLFNEKANMILSKTAESLCSDKETCENMGSCCLEEDATECKLKLGQGVVNKIDSLLKVNMLFYNIQLEYTFEVIRSWTPKTTNYISPQKNVYGRKLIEVAHKNGLILNLIFPDKKQFILAEMSSTFLTSVILIIVVLILFNRTIKALIKERQISEHTTDYLNNMTHEFKTPLTNISLAGKMIVNSGNNTADPKVKHYTEIILAENEKLRLQVEQVLSMTALERGEIPVTKAPVDFHLIIRAALKNIELQIENKNGILTSHLDAIKLIIDGDKNHLINVIGNLLDNSIKYSQGIPEITITTYNLDQDIFLEIIDKGIGIDKRFHYRVFEKYFRVPKGNVHDVKGFGIGLAYVKRILEMHGGTITVQSELNKGSIFTIKLPLSHA